MKIISLKDVPTGKVEMQGAAGAFKQVPISANDGSPSFSVRVFTIEPHGHTPYHQHPFEHLNYVIRGQGTLVSAPGQQMELTEGDFALVLPNEMHQFTNTAQTEPFVIICAVPKEYE